MTDRSCANCSAYRAEPRAPKPQGTCRAKPPTVFGVPHPSMPNAVGFRGEWPPVLADAWCREWSEVTDAPLDLRPPKFMAKLAAQHDLANGGVQAEPLPGDR